MGDSLAEGVAVLRGVGVIRVRTGRMIVGLTGASSVGMAVGVGTRVGVEEMVGVALGEEEQPCVVNKHAQANARTRLELWR